MMAERTANIVVCVDEFSAYRYALELLKDLGLSSPNLNMVACNDSDDKVSLTRSESTLHEAVCVAASKGFASESRAQSISDLESLIEATKIVATDLIVIDVKNEPKSLDSLAARLAMTSETSVLFSKGRIATWPPMAAVFATDFSPVAEQCLNRLLSLAPSGIGRIAVVCAWDVDDSEALLLGSNIAMFGGDTDRLVEERLQILGNETCRLLELHGYRTNLYIRQGKPNQIIKEAMTDCSADLLIVGSEGHGRMTCAASQSIALHHIVIEDYPVLLIRPREI